MKLTSYQLKIVFLTPVLGSQPTKQVASEFLARKAGFGELPEAEIESLPDALERGTTVFHKDAKGTPMVAHHHVKGMLKNAAQVFNGKVVGGVKNLKSKVNNLVFIQPHLIPLTIPDGEEMTFNERPLRAETAMGPRVALARSEQLPEGTAFTCKIVVFPGEISENILRELLNYGMFMGLGQWRNGGYGQFRYELTKEDEWEE